jgi:hypothetical protein
MTEDKMPKKPAVKMEIKVDETIAGGAYSNLCIINHSDSEFVMDFVFIQPGRPKTKVASRIIMSPKNAKRTLMLLDQQLKNTKNASANSKSPRRWRCPCRKWK